MDFKNINITSTALIHFLTDNSQCYVRIKNIATGLYLYCAQSANQDATEKMVGSVTINNVSATEKIVGCATEKIVGSATGSVIILKPFYKLSMIGMTVQHNDTQIFAPVANSSLISSHNKTDKHYFYLMGTLTETYICSSTTELNRYGERGRFLYMTDDGYVHSDGDISIGSAVWQIEKINAPIVNTDVRVDYNKLHTAIVKESKRNTDSLFQTSVKQFSLHNVGCKKYLDVSIENDISYQNKLIGTDEKTKFIIRLVPNETYVYISFYLNNKIINVYTLPKSSDAYLGAPECNWAKFYLIRRNNYYMFQCIHREADIYGNYGRYLCMCSDNGYYISSNGCETDEMSMWELK